MSKGLAQETRSEQRAKGKASTGVQVHLHKIAQPGSGADPVPTKRL